MALPSRSRRFGCLANDILTNLREHPGAQTQLV
jgi:hypothetical protein